MIKNVEYIFPANKKNAQFFNLLSILFKNIEYVSNFEGKELHIGFFNLNPKTIFKLDDNITNIQLNIGNQKYLNLLNRNSIFENIYGIEKVSMEEVATKLKGHIIRIDHTGLNLPTSLYDKTEWEDLIKYIASKSNIYSYPTGEPWLFVLPASMEEKEEEITNFEIVREPKIELCYEEYENTITLQIDIQTDLSKSEVERLFPNNKGAYFKTLENVYKAIYLEYDSSISIRLDIRFKREHSNSENGEWLVKKGKRIKSEE